MHPSKTGHEIEISVEKISQGGDGIARVVSSGAEGASQRLVVFVPYSAAGDRLKVRVTEAQKSFSRGRITQVITPGPGRKAAPCPYYFSPDKRSECGGCNFQHLEYDFQKKAKLEAFKETLMKIAGFPNLPVEEVLGNPDTQWRYRNKIQVPIRRGRDGRVIAGFFAPSSHDVIPIDDCLIHSERMMAVVRWIQEKANDWKIPPYDDKTGRGWLRHVVLREELSSHRMLVVFVTNHEPFHRAREWGEGLLRKFPDIVGIFQNVNSERTNVILGRMWNRLYGKDYLTEKLESLGEKDGILRLKVSVGSFFQVNTAMAQKLYKTARDFVLTEPNRREVCDLYCGVGGIGLALAPHFQRVTGVDEVPSSIADAKENVRVNKIRNADFFRADAGRFLMERYKSPGSLSALVLDPPRAGCSEEVLRKILQILPSTLVYVSCDPTTLARDLKILCEKGYRIEKIQPVDMFPQSAHLESVTLLKRKT